MSKQWYVIHTYSGFERKVKLSIEEQFGHSSYGDRFDEVVIPTEEVVEVRKGKKKGFLAEIFSGLHPYQRRYESGYLVHDQKHPEGNRFSGE